MFAMPGTGSRNFSLRANSNLLYTAGYSVNAGLVDTNTVLNVFDGTNWNVIAQVNGGTVVVYDYNFLKGKLYVGGIFLGVNGVSASGLAQWDGTSWTNVGGFRGLVLSLVDDGTNLYVGGSFTNAGGVLSTNFAMWNGTNWAAPWSGVGTYSSLSSYVESVALHYGQIFVVGIFTIAGSTAATNFA